MALESARTVRAEARGHVKDSTFARRPSIVGIGIGIGVDLSPLIHWLMLAANADRDSDPDP